MAHVKTICKTKNANKVTVASNGEIVFAPKASKTLQATVPFVPAGVLAMGAAASV